MGAEPPYSGRPQIRTEPSFIKAPNACSVLYSFTAPELITGALLSVLTASPHTTTEPSSFNAAIALPPATISTTPEES